MKRLKRMCLKVSLCFPTFALVGMLFGCSSIQRVTDGPMQSQPVVRGEAIKQGKLEIALCTDDTCGEKEVSVFFQNEKPFASSDLGNEKVLAVPVELDFYESIWLRIEKLKFVALPIERGTAHSNEREGVPGCKASFHVRVLAPQQSWYANVCRNRDEVATALSYAVRDVDFMVLKHKTESRELK